MKQFYKILKNKFKRLFFVKAIIPQKYAMQDFYFKEKLKSIIRDYNITTIVETGTFEGKSTVEFAEMVENVIGIELSQKYLNETSNRVKKCNKKNVKLLKGSSPEVLKNIMSDLDVDRTIFFLDAHWNSYWPVIDEIKSIEKNKGIIIIHDFKVPNNSNLRYDVYKNQELSYDYVKNALNEWCLNHKVTYNEKTTIINRGIGYFFSK